MYFEPREFGKRLQDLRKEKGWTQDETAEKLDVSFPYYKKLENGERTCSVELLVQISVYFGVTADYLLKGNVGNREEEKSRLLAVIEELAAITRAM